MYFEIRLEGDGVKVKRSTCEQRKLFDFFFVSWRTFEKVRLFKHFFNDKSCSTTAKVETFLSDGVFIQIMVGVVINDIVDFVSKELKLFC